MDYFFLNYLDNFIILKSKRNQILIFFLKKKIIGFYQNKIIKINKNLNLKINYLLNKNQKKYLKELEKCIKIINNFTLEKINFNGKGFKIKKIHKKCTFLFNKSHKIYLWSKNTKLIKINKNYILNLSKSQKTKKIINKTINIFKLNIFTKKGIRKSSQIIKIKKK